MANWEDIVSGRHGSASEVVRDVLRAHLAEGAEQARQGEFVDGYTIEGLIAELDDES